MEVVVSPISHQELMYSMLRSTLQSPGALSESHQAARRRGEFVELSAPSAKRPRTEVAA